MLLFSTLLLSLILFFSFETNFIYEYSKLLKIKLPKIKEYENIIKSGGQSNYLKFLRGVYQDNFFIQGLTCSICLSFWLSSILTLVSWNILNYSLINFGGLLGYFGLKLLVKYSN